MAKSLPIHDQDCECLKVCKKLGGVYEKCHKGSSSILHERCSIESRQLLLQRESQIPSKLSKTISFIERITLWLIAIGGFVLALIAILK